MRHYYIYIMTGPSGIFYTGMTNDLVRRVLEHRSGKRTFTAQYGLNRLVYFEATEDVREAIAREKQVKPWRRDKKIMLIRKMNPRFLDLGETVLGLGPAAGSRTESRLSSRPKWRDPAPPQPEVTLSTRFNHVEVNKLQAPSPTQAPPENTRFCKTN
jgi:putative endonuclease